MGSHPRGKFSFAYLSCCQLHDGMNCVDAIFNYQSVAIQTYECSRSAKADSFVAVVKGMIAC